MMKSLKMTSTSESWAIYIRPGGKYVVKRLDATRKGLWAQLGPWYDREKAQKLANLLTRDQEGTRAKRDRRTA